MRENAETHDWWDAAAHGNVQDQLGEHDAAGVMQRRALAIQEAPRSIPASARDTPILPHSRPDRQPRFLVLPSLCG